MQANLELVRQERVLRIALNRPDKRNALTAAMCLDLAAAVAGAESDRGIGAVLLEARGPVFCAGMDLDEALQPGAAGLTSIHEELFTLGSRLRKPVVAAIQGPAFGGGVGLIANTHIAVAAEGATFGLTEIRLGMWPFVVFRSVAAALSERRAVELSLTGRMFGTADALAWGLVHQVAPPSELDGRATEIARRLSASSPDAIARGLAFVRASRGLPWREAGELARQMRAEVFSGADFQEGVKALKQRREPRWPSLG